MNRARIEVGTSLEQDADWNTLEELAWGSFNNQITAPYLRVSGWVFEAKIRKALEMSTDVHIEIPCRNCKLQAFVAQEKTEELIDGSCIFGLVLYEDFEEYLESEEDYTCANFTLLSPLGRKLASSADDVLYERIGSGLIAMPLPGRNSRAYDDSDPDYISTRSCDPGWENNFTWDPVPTLHSFVKVRQQVLYIS